MTADGKLAGAGAGKSHLGPPSQDQAPEGIDFFWLMRLLEAGAPDRPRIGDSRTSREDVVTLGQEPWVAFPGDNVCGIEERGGRTHVTTRFLGYFGPQGALPLTTTLEVRHWANERSQRDDAYLRFTEIVSNRFLQLFYRSWANARAIAQHDRPAADRFAAYLGAFAGVGTPALAARDAVPDAGKAGFAGLLASRTKTASRLKQFLSGMLGEEVEIVERVGSWLAFEPDQQTALGQSGSALGAETMLGARVYSVSDTVAIRIRAGSLDAYRSLLPSGARAEAIADLVFLMVGHRFHVVMVLGLPVSAIEPVRLGRSGQLGWTSWVMPPLTAEDETGETRFDARYAPLAQRAEAARRRAAASAPEAPATTGGPGA